MISWKVSSQILASLLPPIFTFTLPVAVVIGEILTLTRLATDHEWGALEAGGLNRFTRFGPFIFIGMSGFALILVLNWNIAPQAIAKLKEVRNTTLTDNAVSLIQPQTFISEFPGLLLKIKAIDQQTKKWDGVLLIRKDEATSKLQLLAAKSGSLAPLDDKLSSFEIKLSNGVFIENLLSINDHTTSAFKENTIKVTTTKRSAKTLLSEISNSVQLSTMGELLSRLKKNQPNNKIAKNEVLLEIFKRLANAFACIFASLSALVLSTLLRGRSARKSILLLISFLLLVAYYAALTIGQNLYLKDKLTSYQSVLSTFLIPFLILGIIHLAVSSNLRILPLNFRWRNFLLRGSKEKLSYNASNSMPNDIPPFNLGHYLIFSEFVKMLTLTSIILTTTILLFTLLDIAPSIAKSNVKTGFALGYLLRLSPQIIYYVAPFGILLATVAAATALSRTGQLTILLYYSVNPIRLALPLILGTFLIFLSILFLSDTLLPNSNREQDNRYRKIKGKAMEEVTAAFDRQWVSDESLNTIYGFRLVDAASVQKLSVLVIKLTNPKYLLHEVLYIDEIDTRKDSLKDSLNDSVGFCYKIGEGGFAQFAFLKPTDLPPELENSKTLHERTYREASKMSFKQLQAYISQVEKTGLPTLGLQMEKMQKLAFPFACITLLFLAFPICLMQLRRQHQSRFSSIAISVTLALLFWGILSIFEAAGKRGILPIFIAAWSPHALFLALASTIQLKSHHL